MTIRFIQNRIIVRGAGDVASGVIRRLIMAGFEIIALEKPNPECVRRKVCFAEAYFNNKVTVEEITAVRVDSPDEALKIIGGRKIPLLIDCSGECISELSPLAVIDARMLKSDIDIGLDMAPIVIGLGPGFTVGENCHAAVETIRGIDLGRAIYEGATQSDTGIPARVNGIDSKRVLRAPIEGRFSAGCKITDMVKAGQTLGEVAGIPVRAEIDGVVRGLIHDGLIVAEGLKIGDIDPRGIVEYCYKISDKANAIGGGVLEALMLLQKQISH